MQCINTHVCADVGKQHTPVGAFHPQSRVCMCRSSTCVCAIQTHTHTRVFIECTGACLGAARTCVRSCARHVCVCAHEKNEAAPVIVAVSRPPPLVPPEPVPVTIPIPSHRRPYASPFVRASVGRKAERCSTTPGGSRSGREAWCPQQTFPQQHPSRGTGSKSHTCRWRRK